MLFIKSGEMILKEKEKDIEKVLREIVKRGNNAEVRQDKNGRMVVYEIEKKKRYIDGV